MFQNRITKIDSYPEHSPWHLYNGKHFKYFFQASENTVNGHLKALGKMQLYFEMFPKFITAFGRDRLGLFWWPESWEIKETSRSISQNREDGEYLKIYQDHTTFLLDPDWWVEDWHFSKISSNTCQIYLEHKACLRGWSIYPSLLI